MDVEAQAQLVREFMLAIAPQVVTYSLDAGLSMSEAAALTLECSMQLAARYNELHETLTAPPPDPAKTYQPKASSPTPGVHKAQARIPIDPYRVPDMPGSEEQRRPSPLSPDWRPPESDQ